MKFFFLRLISVVMFCLLMQSSFGMVHHTKLWLQANFLESFPNYPRFKYYIEPQLRFIDDAYKFHQTYFLLGLGYQATPTIVLIIGPGNIITKTETGQIIHIYRLWEQMNWNFFTSDRVNLINRMRLDENKNTKQSQVAVVWRERLLARFPFANWDSHSLVISDELFFNLNRPTWVAQTTFEQNRAFIGIGTQIRPGAIVDIGYLNQYLRTNPIQMSNVLTVTLSVVN